MTEFNEFLIEAEKFNKLMFLILILLIIIAPLISLAIIFIKKNKIRNNKNESEENLLFENFTWVLIVLGFFVLMTNFVYFY